MKFGEVQKYITDLHYLFSLEPLIVSESIYQDQNKATKKAIIDAGNEATAYSLQWLKDQESKVN